MGDYRRSRHGGTANVHMRDSGGMPICEPGRQGEVIARNQRRLSSDLWAVTCKACLAKLHRQAALQAGAFAKGKA